MHSPEDRRRRANQLAEKAPYPLPRGTSDEVRDALLAARDARQFHVVRQVANHNGLLICSICFREQRLAGFTLSECTNVNGVILCNNCYVVIFGETLKDQKLRLMREDAKRYRR